MFLVINNYSVFLNELDNGLLEGICMPFLHFQVCLPHLGSSTSYAQCAAVEQNSTQLVDRVCQHGVQQDSVEVLWPAKIFIFKSHVDV